MNITDLAKLHNWNMPTVCPICGGGLEISENHKQMYCGNEFCKSKFSGRIHKWTDKMKILEFGLTTIEKLYDAGIFASISDLYKIDYKKIENLEGFGVRSAQVIKEQLDAHRKATLAQFISGYNISDIGEKIIQRIIDAKGITSFDEFVACVDYECDGVGTITSDKLKSGIKVFESDMRETLKYITLMAPDKPVTCKFNGKSFCFTGAAQRPRKELTKLVVDNGGIAHDSVKKDTTYLVLADVNSTSSKAVKARKQGTILITEDEFVNMCNA